MNYRIAVSTETGTDGTVTITDNFIHKPGYGVIDYKEGGFSLKKVDASGTETDFGTVTAYLSITKQGSYDR